MPVGNARLALVLVTKQELARLYLGARLDLGFPVLGMGEGRYRSPPRPKSLREIMKEKESNERD
jgi:hypothetical protein